MNSHWAVVHDGKIELPEGAHLPDGVIVLVTVLPQTDDAFWQQACTTSLAAVWDNTEDDIYAELLAT